MKKKIRRWWKIVVNNKIDITRFWRIQRRQRNSKWTEWKYTTKKGKNWKILKNRWQNSNYLLSKKFT